MTSTRIGYRSSSSWPPVGLSCSTTTTVGNALLVHHDFAVSPSCFYKTKTQVSLYIGRSLHWLRFPVFKLQAIPDPTHGCVNFVSEQEALERGLAVPSSQNDGILLHLDAENIFDLNGPRFPPRTFAIGGECQFSRHLHSWTFSIVVWSCKRARDYDHRGALFNMFSGSSSV